MFHVEHLSFDYGPDLPALRDVSFEVLDGETVCLLGANGCGKSTLLRLLDGLLAPTAGRIEAWGSEITKERLSDEAWNGEFRRRVSLLFQDADVQLFCPTVLEDVAFGPLQLGASPADARARAEELLELFGLAKLAMRVPSTLSGGQKRRVALASCLATDPDVLLMDEPFAALDPRSQVELLEVLQQLQDRGKTILIATHDLGFAEEVAARALLLSEEHTLLVDGTVEEVLSDERLLLQANVIHEHSHRHGGIRHSHPHRHGARHGTHHHTHGVQDHAHEEPRDDGHCGSGRPPCPSG
ncbi:MAG: ABC transporter ATP-binding protein [Planctomycetota bacterium]|nr:MAG: ABC transporter ATP-binding protein [Planctomycetota bacterium]